MNRKLTVLLLLITLISVWAPTCDASPASAAVVAAQGPDEAYARAKLYARKDGQAVQLALAIEIERGWHLYHGPEREDLGPPDAVGRETSVVLQGAPIEWGELVFPTPEREEQDFGDLKTYTFIHRGSLVIRAQGKLAAGGDIAGLSAAVDGLVCKDADANGVCFQYAETVTLAGAGPDELFKAAATTSTSVATGAGNTGANTSTGPGSASGAARASLLDQDLWSFLLLALFWGLFTLLMPCTYPMIPITVSFFTKQAEKRNGNVLPLSLAYGAGIVLIFVLIGVTVGPLIISFAVHPVTNLLFGAAFVYFALVLFGVIELKPPALLTDAAGKASGRGGLLGVFLMGVTLVVTSFTCTAPFVGSLLAVGASGGGVGRIALGMGVFGATMAIPFTLLSLVPGKVRALPRSGEWMHVLKVTLGFVELAAALKFISNSDLVWEWRWLSRELFLMLWFGIFLVAAIYLFGVIRLKDEGEPAIAPGRMIAGLCFTLFSLYCGYGVLGNELDPVMTAIAPPYSNAQGGGDTRSSRAPHAIVKDDYVVALARARSENKRLLVNFTGHT